MSGKLSMWQKEQQWAAWWDERTKLMQDDGTQTGWEKEQAVVREKKSWWFHTFGECYWTVEDKELQWRNHCMSVEGGDAGDERKKRVWWRQLFKEDPPLSAAQIELAREEEIAAARARNQADREKHALMGFRGPAEALAAALRQKAEPEPAALRKQVEAIAASGGSRAASLPRPPIEDPVLFGCPCCDDMYFNRLSCDKHIKAEHGTGEVVVMFHPHATEEELKACLFANLPWQDKVMLNGTVGSKDMDLCYVTKKLVFRESDYDASDDPYGMSR